MDIFELSSICKERPTKGDKLMSQPIHFKVEEIDWYINISISFPGVFLFLKSSSFILCIHSLFWSNLSKKKLPLFNNNIVHKSLAVHIGAH